MAAEIVQYADYKLIPDILPPESHIYLRLQPIDMMSQWKRIGLVSDFTADFFANNQSLSDYVRNSVSTVVNELIENAAKFAKPRNGLIDLDLKYYSTIIKIEVRNVVSDRMRLNFESHIKKYLSGDIEMMYFDHLESLVNKSDTSGMGYLMMYKDYPIRFGYQFKKMESDRHETTVEAYLNIIEQ
ncbi:slr1658 superfamily regulator [Leptospira sp. GIMC2001]|uniref:slr1658 superfamily regulator n=1 Tax=Leptospira sp. GIMC2001 TaxID=1513297 RepID=UPI00234AC8D9|nr:histidine kinase [Leptospira sp. GIMC2001]WCL50315.1 histidine kinase [Leptospira sp. GIMC2001]